MRIENIEIPDELLAELESLINIYSSKSSNLRILVILMNAAKEYGRMMRIYGVLTLIEEAEICSWLEIKRAQSDKL